MASYLALRRLINGGGSSTNLITKSVSLPRPVTAASPTSRFFNTNALRDFDSHDEDGDLNDRRYLTRRSRVDDFLFPDVFDSFSPTRRLSQIMNLEDNLRDFPYISAPRRGWSAKETVNALSLRIDMPGLDKDDVKVTVEQNTLIIKGDGKKEMDGDDDGDGRRSYIGRFDLPDKVFNVDLIKAEMKNGVLNLVLPKIKEEEKTNVINVKIN